MIVVGIDGSESSKRALRWAVEHAWSTGGSVRALHAWTSSIPDAAFDAIQQQHPERDLAKDARDELAQVVHDAVGDTPEVDVVQEVVRTTPAAMLIEASRDADLLVVGSRGTGGFAGLLLGSVGYQCVHHAHCPVVVVPHDERSAPSV
jgi:nucleotide-binding universal stress UspA family protein